MEKGSPRSIGLLPKDLYTSLPLKITENGNCRHWTVDVLRKNDHEKLRGPYTKQRPWPHIRGVVREYTFNRLQIKIESERQVI